MILTIRIDLDKVQDPSGEGLSRSEVLNSTLENLTDSIRAAGWYRWNSGDVRLTYGETIGHWCIE